ncbi:MULTISPECIES: HlyD family type I secretion periplasmic adaptor subunit [unclassified Mesorhizobium]|uniref:HlyD family type I secretion periplasmic adaptor subunit n=1 Tax=unclassified Mesorhizobium TaxID=325217 RepID=UPI000FCBD147|nr:MULTISPECIES: HlyD family type I secretion periplasmic adaptor subunit [unclassified Mesorhizobium]RUW00452.1 HlyD family type I secretion periplasmic adaptor subunit [Mesorhizobium sp. M1A.F.Ca.IN.020.04.1.1]RUW15816.1 HlyD family type I secretion periplasmic adaptor subunit [Mesorhizobium sp. M1A.F.Ca.IN.020.03.1.1]RWF69328.1 MAG: HlyD family type I secretion periplasmic adaptor subunit [Mesorhizobium sp.]RWG10828.1 MAG: HlyD family type I secretion periplasmic adaptor subunit [Mesorhizobi
MNVVPLPRPPASVLEPVPLRLGAVKLTGFAIMLLFFGLGGGWAALAPLDSAAVAPGVVKVAGDRKLIQHLEGGIIAELNAADGDIVKAGKVLIRLNSTQAKAQLDLIQNRIAAREALAARLRAERDDRAEIDFDPALLASPAAARDAVAAQRDVFAAKYHNLEDERKILSQRRRQAAEEITGLEELIVTEDKQIEAIEGETKDLESLLEKGLTTRERNLSLKRQQRQIEGERATHVAAIARARSGISEIDMQILNLNTVRLNEAVNELSKVEAELFDLGQQARSAKDVLTRTDIVAPVDGIVMDLKVHTAGGVVKPGETLMTVVPLGQQLVVEALVKPEDVETIAPGQPAHVSFPAFARYNLPPLEGLVGVVSADRMVDEHNGAPYFAATVLIDKGELAKLEGRKLLPGMSSETMIRTGARTVLSYLAEPITQNFRRAMREK